MNWIFAIAFSLYILFGTIIAIVSRKRFEKTIQDYYTGGGRLGALLAAGTYAATTYSAFMMIGLVGMAYNTGVGALGFELTYLASTVFLLSTVGREIWKMSKERGWIAPSHMLSDLYNSRSLGILASIVYLFAMIPYLTAQIQGLKFVFGYGGIGEGWALAFSATLVYAWIFVAGIWSVAATDLYQGILMLFSGLAYLAWAIFALIPSSGSSLGNVYEALGTKGYLGITGFWSIGTFLAYTLPWAFFAVTNPQVVSRLYLPKDRRSYVRMVGLFFAYGFIYTLIVITVGLIARGLTFSPSISKIIPNNLSNDSVTIYLLGMMAPVLGSTIAVSIIAASVSTANSIVLAVSGSVVSSFLKKRDLLVARSIDALLVIAAALLAKAGIGFIVDLSVITSMILLPLAPITIAGIALRGKVGGIGKGSALASLAIGVSIAAYYAFSLGPKRAFLVQVMGMPISALVLLVSTLILLAGLAVEKFYKISSNS